MNMHNEDINDPVARSYMQIRRRIRNLVILAVVFALVVVNWGMPSFQWAYRTDRQRGIPTAMDKHNVDYWTPGFGWRVVGPGEFAAGCPFVVFIPLRECMDLSAYKNPVTSFCLPKDFF